MRFSNWRTLFTLLWAESTNGKIQFGDAPDSSAQVAVPPTCGVFPPALLFELPQPATSAPSTVRVAAGTSHRRLLNIVASSLIRGVSRPNARSGFCAPTV